MGRLLRIPFLIDLIRTDNPTEIEAFAADKQLDRNFLGRGPLFNRILTRKVRSVLALDGVPLPPVAPRGDQERARAPDRAAGAARCRRIRGLRRRHRHRHSQSSARV